MSALKARPSCQLVVKSLIVTPLYPLVCCWHHVRRNFSTFVCWEFVTADFKTSLPCQYWIIDQISASVSLGFPSTISFDEILRSLIYSKKRKLMSCRSLYAYAMFTKYSYNFIHITNMMYTHFTNFSFLINENVFFFKLKIISFFCFLLNVHIHFQWVLPIIEVV